MVEEKGETIFPENLPPPTTIPKPVSKVESQYKDNQPECDSNPVPNAPELTEVKENEDSTTDTSTDENPGTLPPKITKKLLQTNVRKPSTTPTAKAVKGNSDLKPKGFENAAALDVEQWKCR